MLMEWHKTNLPACRRLNRLLAQISAQAFCVYNQALNRYEVWARGHMLPASMVFPLESDTGTPLHPDTYGQVVLAALASLDVEPHEHLARIDAQNQKVADDAWRQIQDANEADAHYVQRAVAQEADGALRYGAEDVMRGLEERWV